MSWQSPAKSCSPQQVCAVEAPLGPVLVLAGPGAGKTRCLTGRIAHLIEKRQASPSKICAITFTNKAAEEITSRLKRSLGDLVEDLTLGTIHSLCLQLLRAFDQRISLPAGFGVADEGQQRVILSRLRIHRRRHGKLLLLFGRRRLEGYALTPDDDVIYQRYEAELTSHRLVDFDGLLCVTKDLLERTPKFCWSANRVGIISWLMNSRTWT